MSQCKPAVSACQAFGAMCLCLATIVAASGIGYFATAACLSEDRLPSPPDIHGTLSPEHVRAMTDIWDKQIAMHKEQAKPTEPRWTRPEAISAAGIGASAGMLVSALGILIWRANAKP